MRKYLVLLLAGLLFVSCASTNVTDTNTEKSFTFKLTNCNKKEICVVEDPILREKFNTFNELLFNNKLTLDYIGYMEEVYDKNEGLIAGKALYNNNGYKYTYGIALEKNKLKDSVKDGVLIHEMTHIYFYQRGQFNENHGKNFYKKINELNKLTKYVYRIQ